MENLLKTHSVHESIIRSLRVNDTLELLTFTALDSTEDGFTATTIDFGVDIRALPQGGGFPHKRALARLITAWEQLNVQLEVTLDTHALAKVHGGPILMIGWGL